MKMRRSGCSIRSSPAGSKSVMDSSNIGTRRTWVVVGAGGAVGAVCGATVTAVATTVAEGTTVTTGCVPASGAAVTSGGDASVAGSDGCPMTNATPTSVAAAATRMPTGASQCRSACHTDLRSPPVPSVAGSSSTTERSASSIDGRSGHGSDALIALASTGATTSGTTGSSSQVPSGRRCGAAPTMSRCATTAIEARSARRVAGMVTASSVGGPLRMTQPTSARHPMYSASTPP